MPEKLCECGCGQPTPLAKANCRKRGHKKGEPVRFVSGHQNRGRRLTPEQSRSRSQRMEGHSVSAETRRRISEILKGHGIKPSAEACAKSHATRHTGDSAGNWKGGVTLTNGYRCVYMPEHPRAHPNGYVYEHILILERKLGRPLADGEVSHHLDGGKLNNRPENLDVVASQADHVRIHRALGDLD